MNDETFTAPDDSTEATAPQQEERTLLTQSQFTREQQLDQDAALASLDETSRLPGMDPDETSLFPNPELEVAPLYPSEESDDNSQGPGGTRLSAPAAAYAQPSPQPYMPEPAPTPRRTWSKMGAIAATAAGIAIAATMAGKAQTPRSSNVGLLGVRPEPEPAAEVQPEDAGEQENTELAEPEAEAVTYTELEPEPEPEPESESGPEPDESKRYYPGAGVGTITINYGPFSSPTGNGNTGYEDDSYDNHTHDTNDLENVDLENTDDTGSGSGWYYDPPSSRTTTNDDLYSTNDNIPRFTFDDDTFTYFFGDGTYVTLDYDDIDRFLNSYDSWDYDDRGSTYYNHNNYGGY